MTRTLARDGIRASNALAARRTPLHHMCAPLSQYDADAIASLTARSKRTAQRAIAAVARDNPDAVVVIRTGKRGRPKRALRTDAG